MENPFLGKKILMLGFEKKEYAIASTLLSYQARLIINDGRDLTKDVKAMELKNRGATIVGGSYPFYLAEQNYDFIVKHPKVNYQHPLLQRLLKQKQPIVSELEIAHLINQSYLIGVTGSLGKTTTARLLREILIQEGKPAKSAGSDTNVLTSIVNQSFKKDIVITPLTSSDLIQTKEFRPNLSILLNVHESSAKDFPTAHSYFMSYAKATVNQTASDVCVYNFDNEHIREIARKTKARLVPFSMSEPKAVAYFDGQTFFLKQQPVLEVTDIKLIGEHNYENILATIATAAVLGVSTETMKSTLSTFNGVEHRLQYVTTIDYRYIYNDSKSTTKKAVNNAVHAFSEPVVLIVNGTEKNLDFSSLLPCYKKAKAIIAYGPEAERLHQLASLTGNIESAVADSMESAIMSAFNLSVRGDVILFSPGSKPKGEQKTIELRGYEFVDSIQKLKKKAHTKS
ncbi:UDP-N-acetylmuramoyl-L-alanine--D-glutamate ligase [Priestia megaterium]|nr:UDP-N-acetylmuramoyl-L-alanine--D-glutamate ligase [Priestia megaterium]